MEYSEFHIKKEKQGKRKNKNFILIAMLVAIAAFFIFMISIITMSPALFLDFHDFKSEMAKGLSSSRDSGNYTLKIDGIPHDAKLEDISRFVRFIGSSGMGEPSRLPDSKGTYKIEFSDGSYLKVRAERVEVDYHETDVPGAYIEFCNQKCEIFSYLTAKLDYKVIERYLGKP